MTRAELIINVAGKAQIDRKVAEKVIAATFDTIKLALVEGDKVQVLGFGTFENRTRAARKGRNPRTGEEIEIAASKAVAFKAGQGLKEEINN